mmetsp:Transcript_3610/g.8888  ORF Transcript_3610/g.8888 Transcript_3610/m.8888 type:complete len:84 (+) Transcript_3610:884-1135(+)
MGDVARVLVTRPSRGPWVTKAVKTDASCLRWRQDTEFWLRKMRIHAKTKGVWDLNQFRFALFASARTQLKLRTDFPEFMTGGT